MAGLNPPVSLRSSLGKLFIISGLLTLLLVLAGAAAFVRLNDERHAVTDRIDPANLTLAEYLTAYLNEETGIRGYVLTKERLFLEPYHMGRSNAQADQQALDRLLGGQARARSLLSGVEQAAASWETQFAMPAIAATSSGNAAYASDQAEASGKQLFDSFRTSVAALQQDLAREASHAKLQHSRSADLLVGVLVAAALLLGATTFAIWRSFRRRVILPLVSIGEDARTVASGDLAHEVRVTGPREIVDLARNVEAMRRRLLDDVNAEHARQLRLADLNADLVRSNAELEQFAYAASHDLQEPLRKVISFCQLLEQRYGGQLDERADQYIELAVDGAKRMQVLINELLAFSRIGRSSEPFEPVGLGQCVEQAERNLATTISEAGGSVVVTGDLPTIDGDAVLLTALMQNLISNSMKYRSEAPPQVLVGAKRQGADWLVSVEDNGIGIDPRFAEKIFVIFQRLHPRKAYSGTGIGLANCRKIVEFHGGRVWLDTTYTQGARICFTLPARTEAAPAGEPDRGVGRAL